MHNSRARARLPRNYLNFCRCWKLVLINSNFRRRRASRTRTTEHEFNKLNLTVHFADSTRARERKRRREEKICTETHGQNDECRVTSHVDRLAPTNRRISARIFKPLRRQFAWVALLMVDQSSAVFVRLKTSSLSLFDVYRVCRVNYLWLSYIICFIGILCFIGKVGLTTGSGSYIHPSDFHSNPRWLSRRVKNLSRRLYHIVDVLSQDLQDAVYLRNIFLEPR